MSFLPQTSKVDTVAVKAQVGDAAEYRLHGGSSGMQAVASDEWPVEADCTERAPLLFI